MTHEIDFFFFNIPGDWSIAVAENYLIDFSGTEGSIYFLRNLNFFFLVISSLNALEFFLPKWLIYFTPTLRSLWILNLGVFGL